MITRDQSLALIKEHVENKNIIKHMLALEAVMGGLYDYLRTNKDLSGTKDEWMVAGLLHDGDYCEEVPMEKQGIQISEWAKAKGYEIPENVAHAMAAHNWHNTKVQPKSLMDWAIFCADSLTGLIVACALVLPSKKLSDVSPEMVLKKFGQKSFAGGTRREEISLCEKKLEIPLLEFIELNLKAMQGISENLGL